MGCGSSSIRDEYDEKDVGSMTSRDSDSSSQYYDDHKHHEHRGRSNKRAHSHREKEPVRSRSRVSESDERRRRAVVDEEQRSMRQMSEGNYARGWGKGEEDEYDELRAERDLMREMREVEWENDMMGRELKDIDSERDHERRYREQLYWETDTQAPHPDDRSQYSSDISSMSSMLSVLHESPDED